MNIKPLIPVGSKIIIEKSKIKNVLPKKLLKEMPHMIDGEVIDYKMTDGMDIGYVLKTENNIKIWIFTSELNEQTKKEYMIEDLNLSSTSIIKGLFSKINKFEHDIHGNRSVKNVANPVNMISWLIFTLKDIF